ncbi:MAG TPA: hypothetical protein ENK75_05485 [Saprospiraceae bacterium]|nr:hypothetical protein [Saprospiraceae bacterium]
MKHLLGLLTLLLMITSCSTEENINEQVNSNDRMLESFIVKKNADGSYALTTNVRDGVGTLFYDDAVENQVHLVVDNTTARNSKTHNYDVTDKHLNITFISEDENNQPKLSIEDDNTQSTSRTTDFGLLNTYAIVSNEDGSIQLDFEVKDGVDVSFGYNDNENVNDIYLVENANATNVSYSKNYAAEADGSLRIDFIQTTATSRETDTKKPRIVFIP